MGQPLSRGQPSALPPDPADNYQVYTGDQGPPVTYLPPPPSGPPRGLRRPRPMPPPVDQSILQYGQTDADFWDNGSDPVYLPESRGGLRRRPGGFDPFADDDPRGYPPPGSVARDPGLAAEMIARMKARQMNRSLPPRNQPQAYAAQPQSYAPQVQSYAPQAQSYAPQAQSYAPQTVQQPQQYQAPVLYYDPVTGAVSAGQTPAPAPQPNYVVPQVMGVPQGMMPMMGYPQGVAPQGYMYPGMGGMPMMMGGMPQYVMPQAQPAQPIVVPGHLYTRDGGVTKLG